MNRSIQYRPLAAVLLATIGAGAVAAPPGSALPDGNLHFVRLNAQAHPAGQDGITLTVGLAPDDGNPATCGASSTLTARVGDSINICYTVTNTSATTLQYQTLVDSVDGTIFSLMPQTIEPGASYQYNRLVTASATTTYQDTWTAADTPPGYTASAGTYDFVDISGTGTPLNTTDDGNALVTMPFAFTFYGTTSNQLDIGNNGGILFGDQTLSLSASESPLPYPFMGAAILPFWDDLYDSSGNVYWQAQGDAPNREVIVQWNRPHYSFPDPSPQNIDVEAILREDGTLSFEYQNTVFGDPNNPSFDNGGSATVGLQDTDGAAATQYSFDTPSLANGTAIDWQVAQPTAYSATAESTLTVEAALVPPTISVTPDPLTATGTPGGNSVGVPVTVANAGDSPLGWSVVEAPGGAADPTPQHARAHTAPKSLLEHKREMLAAAKVAGNYRVAAPNAVPTRVTGSVPGCDASTAGIIIHDDGVPESGYGTAVSTIQSVTFVDKFTPASYPATFTSACVSFLNSNGQTSQDFDLVVYDDSGDGGGPGTELGHVSATATQLPGQLQSAFFSVDLSSLVLNIASGSVYIGVRYNPIVPGGTYIAADQSENTANAGGYALFDSGDGTDAFTPIGTAYPAYRALLIRAVAADDYCASAADVPWLSLDVGGGMVDAHGSQTINATFDPSALDDGYYAATLCFGSADPNHPRLAVPVGFTVGTVAPSATATPAAGLDLDAAFGQAASGSVTLGNTGTPGSHLDYTIGTAPNDCSAPSAVSWLSANPASGDVAANGSATVSVQADSYGLAAGSYSALLCVATNDAQHSTIAIPVSLAVGRADRVFADGFDGQGEAVALVLDDGTPDPLYSATYDGPFIWLNQFTPDTDQLPFALNQVQVWWSSDNNIPIGAHFDVYVYTDADRDPSNGATLVASLPGQSVTTLDGFQTIALPRPVTIGRDDGDVLIAVVASDGMIAADNSQFPAAIDPSSTQRRSWIGVYANGAPSVPAVLPADGTFGVVEDVSNGNITGNWMIRGGGVTTAGAPVSLH